MKDKLPPLISIVGKSDSGKTTLIEKLIPILKAKGYHVATIKHDAHSFEVDKEGKDSWRHREAGANAVAISSPARLFITVNVERELTLEEIQSLYLSQSIDIILTEGFKKEFAPKIEVNRKERSEDIICTPKDDNLIAVASDQELNLPVPVYNINDAEGIADFIVGRFL